MNTHRGMLKQITKLGLFLMMGVSMSAGAGLFGFGGTSWKEEVLLHDGKKMVVERSQTRGGRHEIGQEVPVAEHIISFKQPGTEQIVTWKSEYGTEIEKSSLLPLALDVVGGTPYIVATPAGCLAYNKWERPNPPYIVQKFDGKTWQRIPLSAFPTEIKEANVVISALVGQFERRLTGRSAPVPASEIRSINTEARDPNVQYLRVLVREPLKPGSPGVSCPDYNSPRYMSPKAPNPITSPPTGGGQQ